MEYYNLFMLPSPKRDFLCRVPIHGYEEAVNVGHRIAERCNDVYIKSIPVDQCKPLKYMRNSNYYDY